MNEMAGDVKACVSRSRMDATSSHYRQRWQRPSRQRRAVRGAAEDREVSVKSERGTYEFNTPPWTAS